MTIQSPPNERATIAAAQRGDRDAIGALWDAHTPALYGYLCATVRDRARADDLLQQAWIRTIEALPSFRDRGARFRAWLFAIARNECRQHWRRQGREVDIAHAEEIPAARGTSDDVLEVERILARLTEDDRELLRLRYIADLPVRDIARVLDITVTAAHVRLHRALRRARTII